MPSLDRDAARQKLAAFRALPDEAPSAGLEGRGIVVCAGGAHMFLNAYVLIDTLRNHLGCTLPIEVWHLGPEEMTEGMAALLREHGVRVVDAVAEMRTHPASIVDGWQLKAYALLRSRFAEVLMLDADQVCIRDPAEVFHWELYRETGAVFWPDVVDVSEAAALWDVVGLPPQRHVSIESGQLVVDKRRHWNALRTVLFLNEEAETYYRLVYGDKDTFLVAWMLTGSPFHILPHRPISALFGLVQRDPDGIPLFQHRTGAKWKYSGMQLLTSEMVHEEACLRAIDRARASWGGRVFHPPLRSAAARAAEAELAGARLHLTAVAHPEEVVELLPYGDIGEGRTPERQHWFVEERNGTPVLILHDGTRETHVLSPTEGHWIGKRFRPDEEDILARAAERSDDAERHGLIDDLLRAAGHPGPIGDDDLARLAASVTLLARVDPGVDAALTRCIARVGAESATGLQLQALADEIAPKGPVPKLRHHSGAILEAAYHRMLWR